MVLSMKNPWIFIRIQILIGVFRVMIKHLLITSYYYHPIKLLNVTVKSHVYSKFSNSVSDREHCNIYRVDEISIVLSNLFIYISHIHHNPKLFGGTNIIITGDLVQLFPIDNLLVFRFL